MPSIQLTIDSDAPGGTAAAGAKVNTQKSADAGGNAGACTGESLDTAATPSTKQHARPEQLNITAASDEGAHRSPVHGKLRASEEELVQQLDSSVWPVGLVAGAHQVLHHRAQGKDAIIGVHLVLLEILHIPFYRLDVATHLHQCMIVVNAMQRCCCLQVSDIPSFCPSVTSYVLMHVHRQVEAGGVAKAWESYRLLYLGSRV